MWKQAAAGTDAVDAAANKDKQHCEDSQTDSGFLSGSNLMLSSELSIEDEPLCKDDTTITTELTKVNDLDPGTDLGQLLDKEVDVTTLDSGVIDVKTEELISLELESEEDVKLQTEDAKIENDLVPWQVYFAQDDEGDTQLHLSIIQEFTEATLYLIDLAPYPCLLDILNDDWEAPLHLAVETRQPGIVRKLILAGADPSIKNFTGNTPLHLACNIGDLDCVKALTCPLLPHERSQLGGKQGPTLPQDMHLKNYSGKMCLHLAVLKGNMDLVRHLLRVGADLEGREGLAGYTALHLAIERGQFELARLLVRDGRARLDARTYAGRTALALAQRIDPKLASDLVRLGGKPSMPPELLSDSDSDEDEEEEEEEGEGTEDEDKAFREAMEKLSMAPKPIVA